MLASNILASGILSTTGTSKLCSNNCAAAGQFAPAMRLAISYATSFMVAGLFYKGARSQILPATVRPVSQT